VALETSPLGLPHPPEPVARLSPFGERGDQASAKVADLPPAAPALGAAPAGRATPGEVTLWARRPAPETATPEGPASIAFAPAAPLRISAPPAACTLPAPGRPGRVPPGGRCDHARDASGPALREAGVDAVLPVVAAWALRPSIAGAASTLGVDTPAVTDATPCQVTTVARTVVAAHPSAPQLRRCIRPIFGAERPPSA